MVETKKRFKKNRNLLDVPAIINSRFLINTLKIVVHGKLNSAKLATINSFFKMVDIHPYEKDIETLTLLKAVESATSLKLDGVNDHALLTSGIEIALNSHYSRDIFEDIIEPLVMNVFNVPDQEIDFVMKTISLYTKYGFILESKDAIISKLTNVESGSIKGVEDEIKELEEEISQLYMKLHKMHSINEVDIMDAVSILDPEFTSKHLPAVHKASKNKKRVLKTGIQALNEMLGPEGGFLTGKMYLISAPVNSFKSAFLLYCSWWISKYNTDAYVDFYKTTGKRPSVLLVSLENTWDENIERLVAMVSGGVRIAQLDTSKDVEEIWNENVMKSNPLIDITLLYARPNRFGVSELEQKIDELEVERNCKFIAVVIDFLRNMREDSGINDPRLKVIQLATDLHSLVTRRPDICLITAHHTSAEGERAQREHIEKGATDKAKVLDRTHNVEAKNVDEPVDFSCFISPEQCKATNQWFLGVKKGKTRGYRTDREYFALPLINKFFIKDDINGPPSHLDSIADADPTRDKSVHSDEIKKGVSVRERGDTKNKEIFNISFKKD